MTSEEERIVNIDKRQESFETFMRAYIDGDEKRIARIDSRMDRLESKLDNILVAGGIGVLTIIVTILASK